MDEILPGTSASANLDQQNDNMETDEINDDVVELSSSDESSDDVPEVDDNDEEFDIDREPSDSPHTSEISENFNVASKLAEELAAQEISCDSKTTAAAARNKRAPYGKHHSLMAEAAKFITQNEIAAQTKLQKELKNLQFMNPGGAIEGTVTDPEKLLLENIPKLRVRRQTRNFRDLQEGRLASGTRENKLKLKHGPDGELMLPGGTKVDLCDCLNEACPGCHPQCRKCDSPKCSFDCRNKRKFIVECVEVLGTDRRKVNPYLPSQQRRRRRAP